MEMKTNNGYTMGPLTFVLHCAWVFCLSYPGRRIHWHSVRNLHRRRTRRQEPSTRPRRCSACEEACPPAVCCGGHTFRSRVPRRSALPRRESQDMTPSRGWWPGIGGKRWTRPWGRRTLHCRRSPEQIWNKFWILGWGSKSKINCFKKNYQQWCYPLRVSGAKLRVLTFIRLYLLGWYWWGELGSTLEKLLSAAMVSIFTHPSLVSRSDVEGYGEEEVDRRQWGKLWQVVERTQNDVEKEEACLSGG